MQNTQHLISNHQEYQQKRANSHKEREKGKKRGGFGDPDFELSDSCFIITMISMSKKIHSKMKNFTGELKYMKNEPNSPRIRGREKATINI